MANLQLDNSDYENPGYRFIDYKDSLKTTVKFEKNKSIPFHRWYPFVEGFSDSFIRRVLSEVDYREIKCLEPFCGSGTTPLTLQRRNILCHSFEVSPLMHLISKVKMRTDYSKRGYENAIEQLRKGIGTSIQNGNPLILPPSMNSMVTDGNREKWLFHSSVMEGILDIKYGISCLGSKKYRNLFKVSLASILLEISNVYRNGKCVSYKKDWKGIQISREQVHRLLFERLAERFTPDLENLWFEKRNRGKIFSNADFCTLGDVRNEIGKCENNFFNLVITSPPYLNSRDYTDSYMVELWVLDLVRSYEDVRKLRKSTIKSHVQVKWENEPVLDIENLTSAYNEIMEHKDKFWNESIPDMIAGYFNDMNRLFEKLAHKMCRFGKVYFNVANSAYYGVHIPTDEIIAEIAERNGFKVSEIWIARHIPPSSQQKALIGNLRESVIVMTKI